MKLVITQIAGHVTSNEGQLLAVLVTAESPDDKRCRAIVRLEGELAELAAVGELLTITLDRKEPDHSDLAPAVEPEPSFVDGSTITLDRKEPDHSDLAPAVESEPSFVDGSAT